MHGMTGLPRRPLPPRPVCSSLVQSKAEEGVPTRGGLGLAAPGAAGVEEGARLSRSAWGVLERVGFFPIRPSPPVCWGACEQARACLLVACISHLFVVWGRGWLAGPGSWEGSAVGGFKWSLLQAGHSCCETVTFLTETQPLRRGGADRVPPSLASALPGAGGLETLGGPVRRPPSQSADSPVEGPPGTWPLRGAAQPSSSWALGDLSPREQRRAGFPGITAHLVIPVVSPSPQVLLLAACRLGTASPARHAAKGGRPPSASLAAP